MLQVIKEVKNAGKTIFYEIQNEAGQTANVRPSQLDDFCILRDFKNAKYTDGKLVPIHDGFKVSTNMTPIEQRKEDLLNFVHMLFDSDIRVSAVERSRVARCDPNNFQLEAMGYVGKISIMPGTEGFNRNITDRLRFTNVRVSDCRDIHPSYGYGMNYIGWKTSCPYCVNDLQKDYYFRIEQNPYYAPQWMERNGINTFDVKYLVYVKGNINGCVAVGDNNKIIADVLFKMD